MQFGCRKWRSVVSERHDVYTFAVGKIRNTISSVLSKNCISDPSACKAQVLLITVLSMLLSAEKLKRAFL